MSWNSNPNDVGFDQTFDGWDSYRVYQSVKHPIRHKLYKASIFMSRLWRHITDFFYVMKCTFIPKYQWHIVDLRKVDPLTPRKAGYIDPCEVMSLGVWAAIRRYWEKEAGGRDPRLWGVPLDPFEKEVFDRECEHYNEVKELYNYWMYGRKDEEATEDMLWEESKENPHLKDLWMAFHEDRERRAEVMLMRAIKARPGLWT